MKSHFAITGLVAAAAILSFGVSSSAQAPTQTDQKTSAPVEVQGGTATFDATTNIGAVSVHGKTSSVSGRAVVRHEGAGIALEKLEATLSVKTITTGMGLRDEHMRKYVFTSSDGQVPDLRFVSDKADCSPVGESESTCNVTGHLAIRGVARPFAIALKVKKGDGEYRAQGDSIVKLSVWGIERPSQFGVTTNDDVKLHLELVARPAARTVASSRSGR